MEEAWRVQAPLARFRVVHVASEGGCGAGVIEENIAREWKAGLRTPACWAGTVVMLRNGKFEAVSVAGTVPSDSAGSAVVLT